MERAAEIGPIKRVFYGVGKAIESQSPRAWNERIIKTINEKVIPKLTPEQRAWLAAHPKLVRSIEFASVGMGVAISTTEMFLAMVTIQSFIRRIQKMREIRAYNRLPSKDKVAIALGRSYATMPETLIQEKVDAWAKKLRPPEYTTVVEKVPWKPRKKWAKITNAIMQKIGVRVAIPTEKIIHHVTPLSDTARWFINLGEGYNEKYANSAEAALLVGTVRVMLEHASPLSKKQNDRPTFLRISRDLTSGSSQKEREALHALKPMFRAAFTEAANRYHRWYGDTPARAMIQRAKADQMMEHWLSLGTERSGLADIAEMIAEKPEIGEYLKQGIRTPLNRDFDLIQPVMTAPTSYEYDLHPRSDRGSLSKEGYQHSSFIHPGETFGGRAPVQKRNRKK